MAETGTLAVILPAYRAQATLPSVLAALRPQVEDDPEVELVVVDSSADGTAERLAVTHPWLRVLGLPRRVPPGTARNLGVGATRADWLAFLDADTVPAPDWLARLRSAACEGVPAVGGAITNGTPHHPVGTSSYLLEFSEFIPGRLGPLRHAASCNLLMSRSVFEAAAGFPEDLWPGEDTVLTAPWAALGRLQFAPDAIVTHLNRTGLADFICHQYRLGRSFAAVCDRVEFPHGYVSRWPLLPAAPGLRLVVLALRLRRVRGAELPVRLTPLLLTGLIAWTAGLLAQRGGFGLRLRSLAS